MADEERLQAFFPEELRTLGRRVALQEGEPDGGVDVGEDGPRPGPEAVEKGPQLIGQRDALRTRARRARVSSARGRRGRKRWPSVRSRSARMKASPGSLFPDAAEYRGRDAFNTLGWIGTTGKPASTSVSTKRPEGRSTATGSVAGAARVVNLARSAVMPAAVWGITARQITRACPSMTQTVCSWLAQSMPTK
jgi:hypothetical protein